MTVRESPRQRRLRSDLHGLEDLRRQSSILDFETRPAGGEPPLEYRLRFSGLSVAREGQNGVSGIGSPPQVVWWRHHTATIRLGANYPRGMPEISWTSPIFHPNISTNGVVCLGAYGAFWVPSLQLDELCQMLWDMIRFANFDVKSPYNREAAAWAKEQPPGTFPLDPRPLRDLRNDATPPVSASVERVRHAPREAPLLAEPLTAEIVFLGEVVERRS